MRQYWIQLKSDTWNELCADGTKHNTAVVAAFWEKGAAYLLRTGAIHFVPTQSTELPKSRPVILIMKDITAGANTMGSSFTLVTDNSLHVVGSEAHVILHQGNRGALCQGNDALVTNILEAAAPIRILRHYQHGTIGWPLGHEYLSPVWDRTGACIADLLFRGPNDYSQRVAMALEWLAHDGIGWQQVHP